MACAPGLFPVPLERLWRGAQKKKPTARSLPAVGWKLFLALLGVSPRAGSGNSLLSRSRGNRHGRLGRNSLGGGSHHCKERVARGWAEVKGEKTAKAPQVIYLTPLQVFP